MKWTNMVVWVAVFILIGWSIFQITGAIVDIKELQVTHVPNEDVQMLLDMLLGK